MNKNKITSIFIILIFLCSIFLFKTPLAEESKELIVDSTGGGNYTRIQDAINNASVGDTVFVLNGTYYENIVINKSIILKGKNKNNTIIYNNNSGNIIEVIADNVTISNFNLVGNFNTSSNGIFLNNSNNVTVSDCNIHEHNSEVVTEDFGNGIHLINSSDNRILDCKIYNNNRGFILDKSNRTKIVGCNIYSHHIYDDEVDIGIGLKIENSKDCLINFTNITDNGNGINLIHTQNSSIIGCNISDDTYNGINLINSSNNTFYENIVSENDFGIKLDAFSEESTDNLFYGNFFENNVNHADDPFNNSWDNGYPVGGNYWDDYNGYDYYHGIGQNLSGSDLIGDTPYGISSGSNMDNYPLLNPIDEMDSSELIIKEIIEPSSGYTGKYNVRTEVETVKITVDGIKEDNEPWIEHFDSPDNSNDSYGNQPGFNFYTSCDDDYMYLAFEDHNPNIFNKSIGNIELFIDDNNNAILDGNDPRFNINPGVNNPDFFISWNPSFIEIKIPVEYWENCSSWAYLVWGHDLPEITPNPSWDNISNFDPTDFMNFPCNCNVSFDLEVNIFNTDSSEPVLYYSDILTKSLSFNSSKTIDFPDWNANQYGNYKVEVTSLENKPWFGFSKKTKSITINPKIEDDNDNPPSLPPEDTNEPPNADASESESLGYPSEQLKFDGSLSSDDGEITNYTWDFDDGSKGYGKIIYHIFSDNKTYNVTLEVTDNEGKTDEDIIKVTILKANNPPEIPTIDGPSNGFIDESYEFSFVSSDKDNDDIKYIIEWGDDNSTTTSFYENNTPVKKSYEWGKTGEHTISVKASDGIKVSKTNTFTILIEEDTDSSSGSEDTGDENDEDPVKDDTQEEESEDDADDITKEALVLVPIATLGLAGGIYVGLSESGRYKLFSLLLALGPLFTRIKKNEALDQEVRGEVYNYIENNPGAYYTSIMKNVGVGNGTISHHLRMLEKMDMVKSRREGLRYRAFYISQGKLPEKEKKRLTSLQSKILDLVKKNDGIAQTELTKILGEKQQTVSYNVKKLERSGFIRVDKKGGKSYCYLE